MRLTVFARPLRILLLVAAGSLSLSGCHSPPEPEVTAAVPARNSLTDDELRQRLDDVIAFTRARRMAAEVHNAWQVVHGILAYGRDLEITAGGEVVSALDYLLNGGDLRGWTYRAGDHGIVAVMEPGTKQGQGHHDQWIGYLSQCGLAPDQPMRAKGLEFKLQDLLSQAQWDIYPGMEASWTLMALSTYLPPETTWTSKDGTQWTVEKIAEMEAGQDLAESPCGGTHRLYGLAMALNHHLNQGGEAIGGWAKVDQKIDESAAAAQRFQQPDGTFSTGFFVRPGTSPDIANVLHATGHTFEFLCMALSDQQIREPWMRRAAIALCKLLEETKDMDVECGALYHAAHGLILYRERMFTSANLADEPEQPTSTPGDKKVAKRS
jgi:hypothetical protein